MVTRSWSLKKIPGVCLCFFNFFIQSSENMYHQLPQGSPSPSSRRTWCRWMTCGGFSADCRWTRWLPAFEFPTMPWFALHPCVSGDPQGLWVWCLLLFTSVSSSVSLSRLICLPTVYLIRHVARTSPSPLPPPTPSLLISISLSWRTEWKCAHLGSLSN